MQLWRKLTYATGNFGNTAVYQVFINQVQFFYITVLLVPPETIGTIWVVFGVWNAINDPLMGRLSDRTRSKMGRRIPYILFGAVPMGAAFALLWVPPQATQTLTVIYFIITIFVFDTLLSLITMTYNALFSEITAGPDQLKVRASLSAWREGFAVVALIAALVVAPILREELGWLQMGLLIGGVGAITTMITVIGHREDPANQAHEGNSLPFLQALKETLQNRNFRWYLGANIAKEYVFVVLVATLPFWSLYALDITQDVTLGGVTLDPATQEGLLLGIPLLLAIPLMAVWSALMKRFGVKRVWMMVFATFIPALVVVMLAPNFTWGLVGTVLAAPAFSGAFMVFTVMLSQIVDEDALTAGYRREGIFFGINAAVQRITFSIQGVAFVLVFALTGFDNTALVQSELAVWGIRFLMGGTPIIACVLGILALRQVNLRP
jgi:GPH family glycoside/pentoside/hexuronide:cation symporter